MNLMLFKRQELTRVEQITMPHSVKISWNFKKNLPVKNALAYFKNKIGGKWEMSHFFLSFRSNKSGSVLLPESNSPKNYLTMTRQN